MIAELHGVDTKPCYTVAGKCYQNAVVNTNSCYHVVYITHMSHWARLHLPRETTRGGNNPMFCAPHHFGELRYGTTSLKIKARQW